MDGRDSSVSLFISLNNPNCSALALEQFYNYLVKFVRQNCVFKARKKKIKKMTSYEEGRETTTQQRVSRRLRRRWAKNGTSDQVGWSIDHLPVVELLVRRLPSPMAGV